MRQVAASDRMKTFRGFDSSERRDRVGKVELDGHVMIQKLFV